MNKEYIFTSDRLGFRNWHEEDVPKMAEISSNVEVMEFFPALATAEQTASFILKSQQLFAEKGYCYFAVDILETKEFIGFIGLNDVTYEASFAPCVDIGWRLHKKFWGKGYATEGAKRCLEYAFDQLKLSSVVATAPQINIRSIHVMQKLGMMPLTEFKHPRLSGDTRLEDCICYQILGQMICRN
ncbi:MAG: GNAT family N-acetyltransferase [Bacteroidetes bacterium]|nr:GNAT family N-acetyltransferase [Bacteroidota bacterium]